MANEGQNRVVVITGASSGIGRATALAFARRGANLALAARRADALQELADACERLGGHAVAVPTDMTDEAAVHELGRRTVAHFGRIDVWVNNASVILFATFEQTPPEAFERVIDTNLVGYARGARTALAQFRRQQGSGTLINVGSIFSEMSGAYQSAYVATKHAIRGLSETLRQELSGTEIHVCTILPAAIDTPLYQHAANFTGRVPRPPAPVYSAEKVAEAIVACAERPRREQMVGSAGRFQGLLHAVAPVLYERFTARDVQMLEFTDEPAEPTMGNLFKPVPQGTSVSGGWKKSFVGARRAALAGLVIGVPSAVALARLRPKIMQPSRES